MASDKDQKLSENMEKIENTENTIKLYRGNQNFKITDLVTEWIYYRIDDITTYFIIYKKDDIIYTTRFYYNLVKKSAYINTVYTNPLYRGQKICQSSISYLIELTKKYIKKYELEVDINNLPAIKCYETNGFKKIKKYELDKNKFYYLMRLKI